MGGLRRSRGRCLVLRSTSEVRRERICQKNLLVAHRDLLQHLVATVL
jgi:hypothetical protein